MYELVVSVSDSGSMFSIVNTEVPLKYLGNVTTYCQINYKYDMVNWLEDFMLFSEQDAKTIDKALEAWVTSLELKEDLQ